MISRKAFVAVASGLLSPGVLRAAGTAYPTRTIGLVVPYAPGGVTDVVARLIAAALATELGQSIIVENITGAGGNLGSLRVVAAAPEGYVLLVTQTSTITNPLLERNTGFHPTDSFTHVAYVGSLPLWLLVNPVRRTWSSVGDLIAAARASPGVLNYGSGGTGSASHLGIAYLERLEHVQATHVPYRGMSAALTDLLVGSVDFALTPIAGSEALVQSNRLRPLAITAPRRIETFPAVPTFAEAGYPAMDVAGWIGISGPRGLPAEVVARLNAAVGKVLADDRLRAALEKRAFMAGLRSAGEFSGFVGAEMARWSQLIAATGIRAE